jgi:hypothetical protein
MTDAGDREIGLWHRPCWFSRRMKVSVRRLRLASGSAIREEWDMEIAAGGNRHDPEPGASPYLTRAQCIKSQDCVSAQQ